MAFFKTRPSCHGTVSHVSGEGKKVALVGNPNVGKSVLFNALTGAYVAVSNYPGTSVEVSKGKAIIEGNTLEIIDTPGMYSLLPITEEERVAREILLGGKPDVVIHVVDARNLERMMAMTLQLMEAEFPLILVVNMMDEAERVGLSIDIPLLGKKLGIPVIGAAAAKKRGLAEIRRAIARYSCKLATIPPYGKRLEKDIEEIASFLHGQYAVSRRAIALLLLQRDEDITALAEAQEGKGFADLMEKVKDKSFMRRESFHLDLSLERKRIIKEILDGVLRAPEKSQVAFNERISQLTVRPLTGIPVLIIVLYALYEFVGVFGAGTIVDFLEGYLFEENFNPWITGWMKKLIPWWVIQELFVGEYGIITLGLRYAVGIILPVVATFFLFFSVLEDSGYFPCLALLVDRLFKKIGLTGRAVIPMVLGFGCDTMATMVTRTLETVRERIIATLLLALAIPCSAQLGVIMGLLSKSPGALAIWGLCVLIVFLAVGYLASVVIPGETPMFYMELPPMRLPQLSNIITKTYTRMQWYFLEVIPLFILASLLLWVGKITFFFDVLSGWLGVVMTVLGLPREAGVAFLFGFFRRDYGAAGLFDLQSKGLLSPRQMTVAAVTLTLFVPCIAQFLIIKKERGMRIAVAIGLFVSFLAFGSGYMLNKFILATGIL